MTETGAHPVTIRNHLIHTATLALAIAALAAPTALARAADMPMHSAAAGEFPTRPVLDRPSAPTSATPDTTPSIPDDNGSDWAMIGFGVAGSLLAVGAVAGIAGRTRHTRRARIAA
jgi:hypothetical protein